MDVKVGSSFKVTRKLGDGAFGEIYHGIHEKSGQEVAIKVENQNSKNPQLLYECNIYQQLAQQQQPQPKQNSASQQLEDSDSEEQKTNDIQDQILEQEPEADKINQVGIPEIYYCTQEGSYNILMMELLGPSLNDLFEFCDRKFSLKTGLLIMEQLIERVQYIHERDYLHRDIKPDNFLIGRGQNVNKIYAVDFGLAKKFRQKNKKHIPYRENKSITGTARYVSINTHKGMEQSRRDDMECLGHVIIYLLQGGLPWQNLRAHHKKDKYDLIKAKKMSVSIEELCEGLPEEFSKYMNIIRNMQFNEEPKYEEYQQMFKSLWEQQNYTDRQFDWYEILDSKLQKPKEELKEKELYIINFLQKNHIYPQINGQIEKDNE